LNHSKFTIPRQAGVLTRERLLGRLAAWDDKKLVIVHAQAGQGKSTLASSYASLLPRPTVWYTMDAGDDDPAVFLSRLGQALSSTLPDQFPKVPQPPRSRSYAAGTGPVITRWIGQLFGGLARPCLIVFDDYHVTAASPALRAIFRALFEGTPAAVRFLLLSRTRPELDIATLRARRCVAELRGSDLKFSDQEAQDLFGSVFGLPLAPTEASAINRTAEGWPAGLVLLHGFLMNVPGRDRLAALAGNQRLEYRTHIFDYLAEEVFAHLPQVLQNFLMHTAVADHLTPALMSALTGIPENAPAGKPSVAALARELSTRNLFVSSIDAEGSVIRYHSLFRAFLLRTFQVRCGQAEVRAKCRVAARWFKATGEPVRAVDLLISSGQLEIAIRDIEAFAQHLISSGQTLTLLRWMHELPQAAVDRPWFLFARAVSCRYSDPSSALMLYERAYRSFHRDRCVPGQMLTLSGIIESCFHTGGDFARMGRTADRAQMLLAANRNSSPATRARLLLAMGMAWFFIGRLPQGAGALRQSLELFRKQGDHFSQITSAIYLIPCALYQGDFPLAREAVKAGFDAAHAIPEETGGRAALFLTKAMAALFEGNFSEAQECIDQCRSLADTHALESIGFLSLDIGGWLKIAQGDYHGAERILADCKRKGEKAKNTFFQASAAHLLAIALLFQGRLGRAKKESDTALALQARSGSRLFHAIYRIASGAILLRLGKVLPAEAELLGALRILRQVQAAQQEANAHLLLASLNLGRGRESAARKHLAAGFSIGEERGFTYYALLTRAELSSLAEASISRNIEPDYCRRLITDPSLQQARPHIRVSCLGGFQVLRNGVPISDRAWKSRLAKTLVKLLAIRGSRKLTRDEAADSLWPNADAIRQQLLLNNLLHRTRKVLEPDEAPVRGDSCIIQDGGLLFLNPRKVWTDIQEFTTLHAAARQVRVSRVQDPGKSLALYDQAFSLYHGDILPGDTYHDWTHSHREHIRKIHTDMLTHAAVLTDAQDDTDRAFAYYDRMFSLDPCNEKACRWLMAWHAAAGQRSDAVRLFERCQLALRKELDIEPDEQTRKVYRSIIGE
jgi:LuxR family maltose regulon positive regulatory protein